MAVDLRKSHFQLPGGPLGRSPPKCETQSPRQTSILVQNFSQIRSTVSEKMRPKLADTQIHTQTANSVSPITMGDPAQQLKNHKTRKSVFGTRSRTSC